MGVGPKNPYRTLSFESKGDYIAIFKKIDFCLDFHPGRIVKTLREKEIGAIGGSSKK